MCCIFSKLIMMHQKDVHGCRFGVFIVNLEIINSARTQKFRKTSISYPLIRTGTLECSGYLSSVCIAYVEQVIVYWEEGKN